MTVIRNATILPMTEKNLFFRGDISIKDGKIFQIGNIDEKGDEEIDGSKMIAMPSFVNCHTHAAMILMRNFKDGKANLQDWLAEIFKIEDKLQDDDIFWASEIAAAELIESGCTTAADMYFYGWNTIKAFKKAGIRGRRQENVWRRFLRCWMRKRAICSASMRLPMLSTLAHAKHMKRPQTGR